MDWRTINESHYEAITNATLSVNALIEQIMCYCCFREGAGFGNTLNVGITIGRLKKEMLQLNEYSNEIYDLISDLCDNEILTGYDE